MYPIFLRLVHSPFGTIELLQRCRSFCHRIVLNKMAAEMPKPLVLNRSIGGEPNAALFGGFFKAGGFSRPPGSPGRRGPAPLRGKDNSPQIKTTPQKQNISQT